MVDLLVFFLRLKDPVAKYNYWYQLCSPCLDMVQFFPVFFFFFGNNYGTVDLDLGSVYLGFLAVKICVCFVSW